MSASADKNIFQLYFDKGKQVPFVVRRNNWNSNYGLVVIEVHPRKTKTGWYGDAIGFGLPPLNGSETNPHYGLPESPKEIPCSGCYQWTVVEEVSEKWLPYLEAAKEKL